MARRRKTPWQRIIAAAENGTGCRLSADDCRRLWQDSAIQQRASLDDLNDQGMTDEEFFGGSDD
jgi:hypothetical protein